MRDQFGNSADDYDCGLDKDKILDVVYSHKPRYLHEEMDD